MALLAPPAVGGAKLTGTNSVDCSLILNGKLEERDHLTTTSMIAGKLEAIKSTALPSMERMTAKMATMPVGG
jgi:hypothetical protein